MKKSDLRSGDIVKLRNGDRYMVLLNTRTYCAKDIIVNLRSGNFSRLADYSDDLVGNIHTDFDIIAICTSSYVGDYLRKYEFIKEYTDRWNWKRKELKTEDTTKETIEKLENLYEEAETRVTLIAGTINATGKILFWKDNMNFGNIGDYAIVENKNGYDLVEIAGKIKTTKENASKFSNTKYEDMKNVITIISKENFRKEENK